MAIWMKDKKCEFCGEALFNYVSRRRKAIENKKYHRECLPKVKRNKTRERNKLIAEAKLN